MIWVTWRQFRAQAWITGAMLAAAAVILTVTGSGLRDLYESTGAAGCTTGCEGRIADFLQQTKAGTTGTVYFVTAALLLVVPAIIGMFWGAPTVARELETGTYRLAWSQSVTSTRWLVAKLLGGVLACMAAAGLLSLAVSWWADPIDQASGDRMSPELFASRGIVPIGYAAFAFVVGVAAGTLLRRTIPAMAVALTVVVAAQLVMPLGLRGELITPVSYTAPFDSKRLKSMHIENGERITVTAAVPATGGWVVSNETVTADGQPFTGPVDPTKCGPVAKDDDCRAWLDTQQLTQIARYQPPSRFWPLQWIETAIFLTLAALLAAGSLWWIRRRLS